MMQTYCTISVLALQEEKERSCMFADELAKMEVKFKEQMKINENLKLQLAAEEDRYKVSVAGGQAFSCRQLSAAFEARLSSDCLPLLGLAGLAQGSNL